MLALVGCRFLRVPYKSLPTIEQMHVHSIYIYIVYLFVNPGASPYRQPPSLPPHPTCEFANNQRDPPPLGVRAGFGPPLATVLIVESDPLQGFLRKSILERQFLDVVRVSDAAEALCLVEQPQFAHRLGLVIASNPMQGIGGPAFVAELHARLPQIPILVLADANSSALPAVPLLPCPPPIPTGAWIRFLPRPFSIDELLHLSGQMLPQPKLKTA